MIEVEPRICPEIGKAARADCCPFEFARIPLRRRGKQAAEQISNAYLIRSPWEITVHAYLLHCFLAGEKCGESVVRRVTNDRGARDHFALVCHKDVAALSFFRTNLCTRVSLLALILRCGDFYLLFSSLACGRALPLSSLHISSHHSCT